LRRKNVDEERLNKRRGVTFICSSAWLASLPERKWAKEFLEKVQQEEKEDVTYQEAKKEAESKESTPKD